MRNPHLLLPAMAFLLAAAPARACLWDYDTIAEEHDRAPTAMETISGTFNRHSPAFYEWRIGDRRKKLEKDPNNFALLDDLGVALCKTGHVKEAVEIGEREVALDLTRYESQSNLGTFYIFADDLEKSAEHIQLALKINPDAHFGREKYQLYLVEYLLEARKLKNPPDWPLQTNFGTDLPHYGWSRHASFSHFNFSDFLAGKLHPGSKETVLDDDEMKKAIIGVLGMMRFAHHDLPMLNEALGDLLMELRTEKVFGHTQQIAVRAYLQSSYHAATPEAAAAYRTLAEKSLELQIGVSFEDLEKDFKDELAQGSLWMTQITDDEKQWIASSPDPDAAFNAKYRDEPKLAFHSPLINFNNPENKTVAALIVLAGVGIALFASALYLRSLLKRRQAAQAAGQPPPLT